MSAVTSTGSCGSCPTNVVFHGDGGGKVVAVPHPVWGRERVGRLFGGLLRQAEQRGLGLQPAVVNGEPGAIVVDPEGRLVAVLALEIAGGGVSGIWSVANPDKLHHLGPVSEPGRGPTDGSPRRSAPA